MNLPELNKLNQALIKPELLEKYIKRLLSYSETELVVSYFEKYGIDNFKIIY